MESQDDHDAPLTWDPQARGGAGGWTAGSGATAMPAGVAKETAAPGKRQRRLVIAATAALLAVATGTVVAVNGLSSGGPGPASSKGPTTAVPSTATEPDPTPTAQDGAAQAAAVDALLDGSSADRKQVGDAVNAVTTCASASAVTDARQKLSEAADHRDALVGRLDGLSVELVDGGAAAVAELRTAWQYSADADRAFADWAASAEGCTTSGDVSRTGDYDRGVESSTQATKAKNTFIEQWNPIAAGYGLSSRSEDQI